MIRREPRHNEEKTILELEEDHYHDLKGKAVKPAKLQTHFVAFANTDGGELYIGIEDRKEIGERINGFMTIEEANNAIKVLLEETTPSVENIDIEIIDFSQRGFVIYVCIPKSPKVHYTSDGKCYVRLNARTSEIKGERVTQLSYSKGHYSYENIWVDNTESDEVEKSTYLHDYLKRINSSLEPQEFLLKQKLIQKNNERWVASVCCVLLFCDEPQACLNTKCAIKVYRLDTCGEEYDREYLIDVPTTIEGPLELQIVSAIECVDNYLNKYPYKIGNKITKYKYPYNVLKEVIVNAVIHRDYSLNDDIHIRIFNNRIEVRSPGGFAGYITEDNFLKERFERNPKIARLLNKLPDRINYELGEGLKTAFNEMKKIGLVAPTVISNENSVIVTLKHKDIDPIGEYAISKLNPIEIGNYTDIEFFTRERIITGNSYMHSTKHVYINAFLPQYPDIKGSCLIYFARLRDCMITFGHDTILNNLFKGLYTDISLNLRGFIVGNDIKDENIYYIQLGNNRIPVFKEELTQLCDIIDDLSKEYLKALLNIEERLDTYCFEKSKLRENGYRLINIKRGLWRAIIEFIREHDYEKGNTPWHIFDANDGMIKVYSKESSERFDRGYHVILYPEPVEHFFYGSFKHPDDEVTIVWEPMQDFGKTNTIDNFNERCFWSADYTYNWLVKELIPYVAYYFSAKPKKRFFSFPQKSTFNEFLKSFSLNNYVKSNIARERIAITNLVSLERLLQLTEYMQSFFNRRGTEGIFLKISEISSLYIAVSITLSKTPLDQYEYIKGNLRFSKGKTLEDIIKSINSYIETLKDGVVSFFVIDTALRSIVVPLRDYKSYLNETDISNIVSHLKPLYEKQLLLEAIERFKSDNI